MSVGHLDQPLVDEPIDPGVARPSLHDVHFGLFVGQRDGRRHVRSEVDAEDGDGAQGQRDAQRDVGQKGKDLGNVGRQGVNNRFLQ